MHQLILALTLVISATADVILNSPCPCIERADDFKFDYYAQGKWYEIARYNNTLFRNSESKCGYTEYTRDGDSFAMKNYYYVNGELQWIIASAKPSPDDNGNIIVTLPFGRLKEATTFDFDIVDTDNKNYAIGYSCKYDEEKGSSQVYAWIWSRFKELSCEVKDAVDDFIQSSDYLDESSFNWNDYSIDYCKDI